MINRKIFPLENIRKHVQGVLTGQIKPAEAKPAAAADGKAAAAAPAKDQAAQPAGTKTRFKKSSKKRLF